MRKSLGDDESTLTKTHEHSHHTSQKEGTGQSTYKVVVHAIILRRMGTGAPPNIPHMKPTQLRCKP